MYIDIPLPMLNYAVVAGSFVMVAAGLALLLDYFVWKGKYLQRRSVPLLWPAIILVTGGGVALSLVYSEYYGFIPCSLCWLQRIALYPQLLLALVALQVKDTVYFPLYGIGLSLCGLAVAVYHYIYQLIPADARESGLMPCLVDGSGADCAVKVIDLFGFVTFPLISAVTFVFLIAMYLYLRRSVSLG